MPISRFTETLKVVRSSKPKARVVLKRFDVPNQSSEIVLQFALRWDLSNLKMHYVKPFQMNVDVIEDFFV